ncbi:MAG: hypothetical protein P4M11_15555 [Candidatus Pacebacteria bacterium]|nr:hypothetical protein [Candidatus Paceibacterota bacterium]
MIGWEKIEGNRPVVTLNPGITEVCDTKKTKMYLYLMCKDKDTADQVADIKYTAEYGDPGFKPEVAVFNPKLGKCTPDEEEKDDMDSGIFHDDANDSRTYLEEPLINDRYYLDNGEGTCEIKE